MAVTCKMRRSHWQPGHSLATAWPQPGHSLATAWPQAAWPLAFKPHMSRPPDQVSTGGWLYRHSVLYLLYKISFFRPGKLSLIFFVFCQKDPTNEKKELSWKEWSRAGGLQVCSCRRITRASWQLTCFTGPPAPPLPCSTPPLLHFPNCRK